MTTQTAPAILATILAITNKLDAQMETLRAEMHDMRDQLVTNQQQMQQHIARDHQQLQQQIARVAANVQQIQAKLPSEPHESSSAGSGSPRPNGSTVSFVGIHAIALDNTLKSRALQRRFEQAKGEADLVHTDAGLLGGRSAVVLMMHPLLCFILSVEGVFMYWAYVQGSFDMPWGLNAQRFLIGLLSFSFSGSVVAIALRLYALLYCPRRAHLPTAAGFAFFSLTLLAILTVQFSNRSGTSMMFGPQAAALPSWAQVSFLAVLVWLGPVTAARMALRVFWRDSSTKDFQTQWAVSVAGLNFGAGWLGYGVFQMILGIFGVFALLGAFFMHRHVSSVARKAEEIMRLDKQTYDTRWATMLADPDNAAQLRRLQGVVDDLRAVSPADHADVHVQKKEGGDKRIVRLRAETLSALRQHAGGRSTSWGGGGGGGGKPQQLHDDLPYLYAQAHALNPHFQARMVQWAGRAKGTTVHHCGVKQQRRAIDKTWRCYAGNPSLLLDLVRGSITCRTVRGIMQCLTRIETDPSVFVLNVKNRFDPRYNGHTTAGYRNLALLLVMVDAETARLGVHDHVCELQLGLAQINELKTAGGHRNYRRWRDMRAV